MCSKSAVGWFSGRSCHEKLGGPPVSTITVRLGRDPDPGEGSRLVTSTMQRSLTALGRSRRFPVIG